MYLVLQLISKAGGHLQLVGNRMHFRWGFSRKDVPRVSGYLMKSFGITLK